MPAVESDKNKGGEKESPAFINIITKQLACGEWRVTGATSFVTVGLFLSVMADRRRQKVT